MIPSEIENRLRQGLVGRKRQRVAIDGFFPAAVLVPLLTSKEGCQLLFTVRSRNLSHHAGQIAFPGGKREPDETVIEAAVREMQEEIGVTPQRIVGELDEQPSAAGFVVTPVIAIVKWPQPVAMNMAEVEEVFTVRLEQLQKLTPREQTQMVNRQRRTVYFYDYRGREIWGLTANIVRNLLQVLEPI